MCKIKLNILYSNQIIVAKEEWDSMCSTSSSFPTYAIKWTFSESFIMYIINICGKHFHEVHHVFIHTKNSLTLETLISNIYV